MKILLIKCCGHRGWGKLKGGVDLGRHPEHRLGRGGRGDDRGRGGGHQHQVGEVVIEGRQHCGAQTPEPRGVNALRSEELKLVDLGMWMNILQRNQYNTSHKI